MMIEGVSTVDLRQIVDTRGAVLHMLRADASDFTQFGECYFSEVLPGAIKAWKRHRRQTQNLAVPAGRARVVVFDDRDGSSTHGVVQVFDLGRPDRYVRLRIPPRLWYGFTAVGEAPALIANCPDMPHDPADGETRDFRDPYVPFAWPHEASGE